MNFNMKGNWPMMTGAAAMFIYFGVGHFVPLPNALRGFLLGLSAAGFLLGAVVLKVGFAQLRDWKKSLLHKFK